MNARQQADRDPRDNETHHGDVIPPHQALAEQTLAVDLARVDIDQQIATAHKFPRSIDVFVKKLETMACYNEAAAENCIYSLPRGGKPILGPSIGFANIVAQAWGNCIDGNRWVATDRREKVVVCEGVFHDLETNRKVVVSEQRKIANRDGRLYNDDMVIMTSKAAGGDRAPQRNSKRRAARALVPGLRKRAANRARRYGRHSPSARPWRLSRSLIRRNAGANSGVHRPERRAGPHAGTPANTARHQALRDGTLTAEEVLDPRKQAGGEFAKVNNPMADDEDGDAPPADQARNPGNGGEPACSTTATRTAAT